MPLFVESIDGNNRSTNQLFTLKYCKEGCKDSEQYSGKTSLRYQIMDIQ